MKDLPNFHRACLLAGLMASASAIGLASPAMAQDAAPQAAAGGLEEIVVTARKRSESLQDIPVAVTAYSPAQIARQDISNIERIAATTPNLTVGRATTGSGAQISLRGIGTPASALGIESSTAIIVDGIYYASGRILNEGFFDLSRIEVLKGPQALFFGKNATAGVISITTADPGSSFEGSTRVGYEFRAKRPYIEQMISTPLTDTLGLRVALRASKMFGGYSRNYATAQPFTVTDQAGGPVQNLVAPPGDRRGPKEKELVGRLTLKWEPTDTITNTFKVSANETTTNDGAWNNIVFSCATGFSTLQPGVPCKRDWKYYHNQMPTEIAANFPFARADGELYTKYRSWQATNNLEWNLGDVTLTSATNYQNQNNRWLTDSDYQQRAVQIYVGSREKWWAFSEELRAQTNYDGPVNMMLGVLYQKTKLQSDQYVYSGNTRVSTQRPEWEYVAFGKDSYTKGETISPFAQVTWKVVPEVELSSGIRYTHETKDSFFVHPVNRPGQINRLNDPIYKNQTFTNWSPEITASYKPVPGVNIYGGFKTGYKSGGFSNQSSYTNASIPADLDFEPEKAKGFEGGVKTTLFNNQLRFDVALYTYEYTNLQVDFFEAQTFRYITTNAGSARTKGVEISTEWAPHALPGLTMRGALNYNKARYVDFIAPCVTGQTRLQGCNPTASSPYGGLFVQDLSGKPTANAPRWTAALGTSYEADLSPDMSLTLSADARYSSSYNASPFNNPIATQPKYVNLDASLTLSSKAGWDLAVIGKNLTNQFVISGALDAPGTGRGTGTDGGVLGDQRGYANIPRTVQVQVTYHY
ncbi:TonB-dependent receptor [Sphingomonas sp. LH128]|uniref:TonB-dependent receptor n=1 Tax=Sphingomonas sp. LH128 TaxID=473781 RepID=UPI00027CC7C0|nr:TonB-dependent receptor [Sphingomonas sp. LH128]EJU11849.1 TonB-dependent receptor [Sphingomonas sp. LH128]